MNTVKIPCRKPTDTCTRICRFQSKTPLIMMRQVAQILWTHETMFNIHSASMFYYNKSLYTTESAHPEMWQELATKAQGMMIALHHMEFIGQYENTDCTGIVLGVEL